MLLGHSDERTRVPTTEEVALRDVAMLVARGASRPEIFEAVAERVAHTFAVPWVDVLHHDSTGELVPACTWGEHPADGGGRSLVPIVVDGVDWGAIAVPPLPDGEEARLKVFAELVAFTISNAEARDALAQLAEEQAALRRVATLVARESSAVEIFGAVTDEACRVVGSEAAGLLRFEPDGKATLLAQSETPWDAPPVGTQFPLDGDNVITHVFHTGKVARVDDWSDSTGAVSAMASLLGVRSAVSAPVVVDGRLWGTMIVATGQEEPLAAGTEERVEQFTGLVGTAIANADARGALSRLAEEQAALRRVAVLVAQQPSAEEVVTAVTEAVGHLLGADLAAMHVFRDDGVAQVVASWTEAGPALPVGTELPLDGDSAAARIFRTGAAARIDGYTDVEGETAEVARGLKLRTSVGAPIVVEGKVWGALMAATRGREPLPDDAEARIAAFTELVATAVSNTQARAELHRLADEQAALRRVATLVAEDAPPDALSRAVAVEVGTLLGAEFSGLARFADGAVVPLAVWSAEEEHPQLPERWPLQAGDPATMIAEGQRSVRIDDWSVMPGPIAAYIRDELGVRSSVVTPIVVQGEVWGCVAAHSRQLLPPQSEARLSQFSDLVATAIGNTQARGEVARLANEQAALRRIATLIAGGAAPEEVFAAVTDETAATFDALTAVMRFVHDPPENVIVGVSKETGIPIGTRWPLGEGMTSTEVYRTGKSARHGTVDWPAHPGPVADAGLRFGVISQVACPIVVEGQLWGVITLNAAEELPPDTERRLEKFTELVTTAIANAEAGIAVRAAADEQGALRRVATLVASSAGTSEVFSTVTEEIARVLGADATLLARADSDGAVVVGTWARDTAVPPLGTRIPLGGTNLTTLVLETGRSARVERYEAATGDGAEVARTYGLRSAVGAPILVEGRLWGLVIAGTTRDESFQADAEQRLVAFTELVATAVANATARDELLASRARIVAAGDEARRQIQRNLHDGTQQRLVSLGFAVRAAEADIPPEQDDLRVQLSAVATGLGAAIEDLQEISRGIHPAILAKGGLGTALKSLARRSPIPVELDISADERIAEPIELAAYYVASEVLANAAKHSQATRIDVSVEQQGHSLVLSIDDDGVGGADVQTGSGLVGLADRVAALGGSIRVTSAPGDGTHVVARLPLEGEPVPEAEQRVG